jgi:hypothetical protein
LPERPEQPGKVEKLGLPMGSLEMVHRHLDNAESGLLNPVHHLKTNRAAIAG